MVASPALGSAHDRADAARASAGSPTAADSITLPAPVRGVAPVADAGLTHEQLRTSQAPGAVDGSQDVTVAVGPTGAPADVTVVQRLRIRGTGDYAIRQRGPARSAVALDDTVPPVLDRGTVVWQGFSPGERGLAARLTLDPGLEAPRLPLAATVSFQATDGRVGALDDGAVAPADGTAYLTLTNQTGSERQVQTGVAQPLPLATALDRLRTAAEHPGAAVPPTAGDGLPLSLPGRPTGTATQPVVAPLVVTGSIRVPGSTGSVVSGPGTSAVADGTDVSGTLAGQVGFQVRLRRGQRLTFDLGVQPWLDPRDLAPPAPADSWQAWAGRDPTTPDIAAATATLVAQAAAAARAAEYSPYLQSGVPGAHVSTFRYVVAPATATRRAGARLTPRPGPIAAVVVALLAITGNAVLLRRRL
jgi:hypothetical protein